jgi:hypothetical protein
MGYCLCGFFGTLCLGGCKGSKSDEERRINGTGIVQ